MQRRCMNEARLSDPVQRSSFIVHHYDSMAWIAEDRRNAVVESGTVYLTDDMKINLAKKYFPRYPTKRACLLPVLHAVQHAYGWIPAAALVEVSVPVAPAAARSS